VTFEANINFYTDITFGLLDWSQASIKVPISSGTLWMMIISIGIQQRASDYIGSQRALGSTYFTTCRFTPANFMWFNRLHGSEDIMLEVGVSLRKTTT
jgi:Nitrate and nitrite sensing